MNKSVTLQQSSPLHLENTVANMSREDLRPQNFPNTVRQMTQDPVISGSMSFLKSVMNKPFKIAYHERSTDKEKALIDGLNQSLNNLTPYSMTGLMANILSMLDYGYSLNEVTLRRVDGLYVFDNLSPIHPSTVSKFRFERGVLKSVKLSHADNDGMVENVEQTETEIEGSKLLLITNDRSLDHPTGRSLLHGCYQSWKTKQIVREYQTISVAKNLSGIASISIPSEYLNKYYAEPNSDEAIFTAQLFQQAELLHAGKSAFVCIPSDIYDGGQKMFSVDVIGSGSGQGNQDVEEIVNSLNNEIMLSLQTLLLSLGKEGGGSYALSSSKTEMLQLFVKHVQQTISSEFQKVIRLAFDVNGIESNNIPHLEFEQLETIPWSEFCEGWSKLANSQIVTPTTDLEEFVRKVGKAPKANYVNRIVDL